MERWWEELAEGRRRVHSDLLRLNMGHDQGSLYGAYAESLLWGCSVSKQEEV